jgi:hypothetical protein
MEQLYQAAFPDRLGSAFAGFEWNGFGFQAAGGGPNGVLVIACLWARDTIGAPSTDCVTAYLRDKVPDCKTVECIDYLGRLFVRLHFGDWNAIARVLQTILDHGDWCLTTHNKLRAVFRPKDAFSWANMEARAIAAFMEQAQSDVYVRAAREKGVSPMAEVAQYALFSSKEAWIEHYNWQTAHGKAFCSELRRALGLKPQSMTRLANGTWQMVDDGQPPFFCFRSFPDDECKRHRVLHRGVWSAYEPSANICDELLYATHHSSSSANKDVASSRDNAADSKDKDGQQGKVGVDGRETCIICQERPADTMVLPCGHSIVCVTCSKGLAKTGDARNCVQCRQRIDEVLAP